MFTIIGTRKGTFCYSGWYLAIKTLRLRNTSAPPLQSRHICSWRKAGMSSLLTPFSLFMWYFSRAQADSASWVWTPVRGSTKLSWWTTLLCTVTLGTWRCKFLYAAQSSVWTSEPGRSTLCRIWHRVARSLRCTTWKYPLQGMCSVDITPNTQQGPFPARRPLWYWKKSQIQTYVYLHI